MITMKNYLLSAVCAVSTAALVQAAEPEMIPVEVPVGETTCVMLAGNPSTGYCWYPDKLLPKNAPFKLIIRNGKAPEGAKLVGVPSQMMVCFKGIRPGTYKLRMIYARPWEKAKKPANEALFEVRVTE